LTQPTPWNQTNQKRTGFTPTPVPELPRRLQHPKTKNNSKMSQSPEYEEKLCVKCGEKTPHEMSSIGVGTQLLILFPFLVVASTIVGPLGGLGTLALWIPISVVCNRIKKYQCDFCQTRFSPEKANRYIREHNRDIRKQKWEEDKRREG
jgi:hypothetical protein